LPRSSNPSTITLFTSSNWRRPVICLVPVTTDDFTLPPEPELTSIIRRYPHQLLARPAPHCFIAWLRLELLRSQVLKAQGTKSSSAALLTIGSAKIAPASLHPAHPLHSTKLAKIGFPVSSAACTAASYLPCFPSGVKLT